MSDPTKSADPLSIRPTRDDLATFGRAKGKAGRGRAGAPKQGSFIGMLVFVMVLMAIVMGIGGYTIYEVQNKLDRAAALLAQSEENIRELEMRLNATGSDVSKTLVEVKDQLSTNEHEIRKLWDVSNKRNRQWIETNQKTLAEHGSRLQSTADNLARIRTEISSVNGSLKDARAERELFQKRLSADMGDLVTQVTLLRGQVQEQADTVNRVNRDIAEINSRQKSVGEAIQAIDEHRRIINQQLAELQNQVRSLQGPGNLSRL